MTPQGEIYAVVDYKGIPATTAPSGRWAFKSLSSALHRRDKDRQRHGRYDASDSRVARYKFDGWAD